MKFAVTVGAFELDWFVELQILSLRHVFGPEVPVLISDDISQRSAEIRDLASRYGVHHTCSETHRSHFAGDVQAGLNALAFAEAQGADIAIKVSQRLILCEPVVAEIISRYFADPNVWLVLPGRIPPGTIKRAESRFFASLSTNCDVVAIRVGTISPTELKDAYEGRVRANQMRHASLVEGLFAHLIDTHFNHHFKFAPELTVPYPGRAPLFLRKCQSEPADYMNHASRLGLSSDGRAVYLQEWRQLTLSYRPCPTFL